MSYLSLLKAPEFFFIFITEDCIWNEWGEWSVCTHSCGGGIRITHRTILQEASNGGLCDGGFMRSEACNDDPCTGNN